MDNGGVYKLSSKLAIIQTVDFFTPIVDDPYDFGRIAAANSLSDVYSMGGKPVTAMNIVCFPSDRLDISILQKVLSGGADKMKEAGVILIGGHSVKDNEFKYGLSVTGTVNPAKLITNSGAITGDKLILTKPIGTGIISTAMKAGKADKKIIKTITESMAKLNGQASQLMLKYKAHACTDITGFGLIGHAAQMAINSNVCFKINSRSVPVFDKAADFALQGYCPGGLDRNKAFYKDKAAIKGKKEKYMIDLLNDPQTSGGLLISVSEKYAVALLSELRINGYKESAIVGEVIRKPEGIILIN